MGITGRQEKDTATLKIPYGTTTEPKNHTELADNKISEANVTEGPTGCQELLTTLGMTRLEGTLFQEKFHIMFFFSKNVNASD